MWRQLAANLLSYKTSCNASKVIHSYSLVKNIFRYSTLYRCYQQRTDYLVKILGCTLTSLWEALLSLLVVDYMAVWGKGLHHCRCCMWNISISIHVHLPIAYTLPKHCYVLKIILLHAFGSVSCCDGVSTPRKRPKSRIVKQNITMWVGE